MSVNLRIRWLRRTISTKLHS